MDKGNYTGMVLLDLQKAFDTVDHSLLLMKLQAIGLNDKAVSWFQSYLTQRAQCVSVNGSLSLSREIVCGVPQGSILGPLLFLVYVNDMERAVKCKLLLYADDSALLVSGRSVGEIEANLSGELESISKWLVDNKLSLHLGKTESILFGSRRQIRRRSKMNISCGGSPIIAKSNVGYLGAQLDQSLDGELMYNRVLSRSNSRLKFLFRQARYLCEKSRKILASALIQPHFDYACSSWFYGLRKQCRHRLQTCQNKMIRFVLGLGSRSHVGTHEFQRVGWLPVEKRVCQLGLNCMYKILSGEAPSYLSMGITRVADSHSHFTRSSLYSLVVVKHGSHGQKTFQYCVTKSWNDLPASIQSLPTLGRFKQMLKRHLMQSVQL